MKNLTRVLARTINGLSYVTGAIAALALARTQAGHVGAGADLEALPVAERVMEDPYSLRGDGNTVQLEQEMSNLAENTLMYNAVSRFVADKFRLLQSAIKGGGGGS